MTCWTLIVATFLAATVRFIAVRIAARRYGIESAKRRHPSARDL